MTEFDEVASFLIQRASEPSLGEAESAQLESLLFAYLNGSDERHNSGQLGWPDGSHFGLNTGPIGR